MLLLYILLQTQLPELELPKVVIYGKREVKVELIKGSLIPDTIPYRELPIPNYPELTVKKGPYLPSYKERNSMLKVKGCIGGSGMIECFYGREKLLASLLVLQDIKQVKEGLELKLGCTFGDITVRTHSELKGYIKANDYKVFKANLGYALQDFSLKTHTTLGNLDGSKEYFGVLQGNLVRPAPIGQENLQLLFGLMVEFRVLHDSNKLELFCGGCGIRYRFKNLSLEPGVKILSKEPWGQPSLSLELLGPLIGGWLKYYPAFRIITRNETLKYNRFISSDPYIDKSKTLSIGGRILDIDLDFKYIKDHPYFVKSGSLYSYRDTTIMVLESLIRKFGGIRLKYNLSGTPSYMPTFILGLDVGWKAYKLSIDYGWWDYNYLNLKAGWQPLKSLSIFIEGYNLFDETDKIFDVYYEQGRKILAGLSLKI